MLPPARGKHDDVPRCCRMLDVSGNPAPTHDLKTENVAIETAAGVLVVAFQRSMGQRLRNISATRETLLGQRPAPVRRSDGPAFGRRLRIVILDLERVA